MSYFYIMTKSPTRKDNPFIFLRDDNAGPYAYTSKREARNDAQQHPLCRTWGYQIIEADTLLTDDDAAAMLQTAKNKQTFT